MSRHILLAAGFISLFSMPAQAAEFDADSALRAVTVYSGHAALTRRAEIEIPAGAHSVVFKGLPASLMPDSLRAEGTGTAKVVLGAVDSRLIAGDEPAGEREREIAGQIETVNDQIAAVKAERDALEARRDFYKSLGAQAALRSNEDIAEINLKPEQWKGAADSVYAGMVEANRAQREQDIALRTLERQKARLELDLMQIRTGRTQTYQVTLPVEADGAATLTVDLTYQVPDADWRPQYDARLDTKTGALELIQYGAVRQNTGEDWTDVALTLSTAQPSRGASLPEPQTQWISLYEAMPMHAKAGRMMAMESADAVMAVAPEMVMQMAGAAAPAAPAPVQAEFRVATIDTGGFVSEYKIPGPSTVKADGGEKKVMVGPFVTEGKTHIRIQPQLSAEAYLASMMTLKGEAPVLPGVANLFRDGAFVGQSHLPLLRPGQEQSLFFGVDDQVAVKRRVMKDEKSQAGVIARDQVLERHFVNEIENLHGMAFDVVVLEAVPVAQDEKIRVDILKDKTTQGYVADADNVKGLLRWNFRMEPKQKKDVNVGVKVGWPADAQLQGM